MIKIYPYLQVNGSWTIPDNLMESLWHRMEAEGAAAKVFHSGSVQNVSSWIRFVKNPLNKIVTLYDLEANDVIGIGWLNNMRYNHGFFHGFGFKNSWASKTIISGMKFLDYFFGVEDPTGIETILSIIPEENRPARAFLKRLGFTGMGTIPKYLYSKDQGKMVGGDFFYLEREVFKKWATYQAE